MPEQQVAAKGMGSVQMAGFSFARLGRLVVAGLALAMVPGNVALGSIIKDEKGLGWFVHRDLTSDQFSQRFQQRRQNYIMIDFDPYFVQVLEVLI